MHFDFLKELFSEYVVDISVYEDTETVYIRNSLFDFPIVVDYYNSLRLKFGYHALKDYTFSTRAWDERFCFDSHFEKDSNYNLTEVTNANGKNYCSAV